MWDERGTPLGLVGPFGPKAPLGREPLRAFDPQEPIPCAGALRRQITCDKGDYGTKRGPFQNHLTLFICK